MLKKNIVKILILTLKMCDLANKPSPTAASPSVANSWQNNSQNFLLPFLFNAFWVMRPDFWLNANPVQDNNRFCRESAAQMTTIGNSFQKIGAS